MRAVNSIKRQKGQRLARFSLTNPILIWSDLANYNVTVSYTNSNGANVSASYPTLALALAANATYNNNTVTSSQPDTNPQVFTVSYTPSSQTAILQTDATDPAGAQTVDTRDGMTAQAITFLKTDSDLARAGYSYQVKAPNGTSYATLTDA